MVVWESVSIRSAKLTIEMGFVTTTAAAIEFVLAIACRVTLFHMALVSPASSVYLPAERSVWTTDFTSYPSCTSSRVPARSTLLTRPHPQVCQLPPRDAQRPPGPAEQYRQAQVGHGVGIHRVRHAVALGDNDDGVVAG